jgi:hypothetical protein
MVLELSSTFMREHKQFTFFRTVTVRTTHLFSLITSGEHKAQVTREDGGDVFQLQISATGRRCACARLMLARTTILH